MIAENKSYINKIILENIHDLKEAVSEWLWMA